jgi:lipopolysaccharide export system ATP-binding protein
MKLLDFVAGLRRHDVSVALGLVELVRRADPEGWLDRGDWLAAVRGAFARARSGSALLDSGTGDDSGTGGDNVQPESFDRYLEEQVLSRLLAEEVVVTAPTGPAWERVGLRPGMLEQSDTDRVAAVEAIERKLDELLDVSDRAPEAAPSPPPDASTLRTEGLVKIYRKRKVVSDVDLTVSQGEIVGLLGPNGAGKTTTFYMVVGLIAPDSGRVLLDGSEITRVPMYKRARRGIGYLAQEPSVFRKLTVEENIMAILETMGLSRKDRKARLEKLLDELTLRHLRKAKAYSLSGGERRRLEITRALVSQPKFMLLDEPFAGIDPIAVNDIQQIVADLRHRGIGVIISDHNVEQTLDIVDRAYIMYDGRVRVSGTVAELVWNDEVAEIYFGPTLTARMRDRYDRPGRVA